MAKLTIKFNSDGYKALLSSQPLQDDLQRRVNAIAAAAGGAPDFEARVEVVGGSSKLGRAMGYVTTATEDGRRMQAEDNVLISALGAGRG